MHTARLHCLGSPRLDSPGGSLALRERQGAEPIEVLLRVVAMGPGGAPLRSLCAAVWPDCSQRQCLARFQSCASGLALLAGTTAAPLKLDAELVTVDRAVLEVDSLELEESLAPLLEPFPRGEVDDNARSAVARTLAHDSVFLPGLDAAWARAARMRIADKLARAARQLADGGAFA